SFEPSSDSKHTALLSFEPTNDSERTVPPTLSEQFPITEERDYSTAIIIVTAILVFLLVLLVILGFTLKQQKNRRKKLLLAAEMEKEEKAKRRKRWFRRKQKQEKREKKERKKRSKKLKEKRKKKATREEVMLALSDYLTSQSKKYETPVEEPTPAASEVGVVGITPHKVSSEVNVEVEREVPSKEVIPAKDSGSIEMPKQPTVPDISAEKKTIETLPLKCSSEKKLVDTSPFISPAITLSGIASTTPSQSGGPAIDKMQSLPGEPKINSDEGRSREHMLPQPVET
ncbi:unnamed protein product, partial [Strongylus vulgaris]